MFAENLRKERLRRGLTQERFALMVGLSRQQVCMLESGSCNPQIKTLERISEGLDMPVWMLLSRLP